MFQLILGSQSPRRREILHFFSIPFQQVSPPFDESKVPFQGDPSAFVTEIARCKAESLAGQYPDVPILTADTTVYLEGRVFLKPESMEEAREMLQKLQGKAHEVYTGVCVRLGNESWEGVERSRVEFVSLAEEQIWAYQRAISPLDKAGGYAIQGCGGLIVKRIEGCYYNILGLPLQTTCQLLAQVGINLWDSFRALSSR